jgi:hypothetical protein
MFWFSHDYEVFHPLPSMRGVSVRQSATPADEDAGAAIAVAKSMAQASMNAACAYSVASAQSSSMLESRPNPKSLFF